MTSLCQQVFASTLVKTEIWLQDLMLELSFEKAQEAYSAYRSVLHALRDLIPPEETLDLASEMPLLIRGFFLEGWKLREKSMRVWNKQDFYDCIMTKGGQTASWKDDVETVVKGVFKVLSRKISEGEIADIRHILPEPVRALWPLEGSAIGLLARREEERPSSPLS